MSIKVGILTISDRAYQGVYEDKGGPTLQEEIKRLGWGAAHCAVIADNMKVIEAALINWSDQKGFDLILTTGGTGLSPRDVTPEATRRVIEKELSGAAHYMLFNGLKQTPLALLSRAVVGTRKKSLIVNLPGNPDAALWSLQAISHLIPHALSILRGEGHQPNFNKSDSQEARHAY